MPFLRHSNQRSSSLSSLSSLSSSKAGMAGGAAKTHHSVTLSLLLFCILLPIHHANKQLVFFAGPHQTGSSSVEEFYHNFASGYNNAKTSESLKGWVWPRVQGDLGMKKADFERQRVFQFLVTKTDNDKAQDILKTAIRDAYNKASEGVILGTEEFDRIGDTPFTHRDGLAAMQQVVQNLRVAQEDVWVILNYRTPRVEQWISFWKHMEQDMDYREFLCDNYNRSYEILHTGMNPLALAQTIRHEMGWNVVLLDLVGIHDLGSDASHIIACEILGGTNCKGGFVADRFNRTYHKNHVEKEFDALSEKQVDQLEMLLRKRDCAFQEKLQNDHAFHPLHESTLWQGCNMKDPGAIYSKLKDTAVLLDLFQSQVHCEDLKGTNLEDYLMESDDFDAMTAKKTVEQMVKEMQENQFENLEAFEMEEEAKATKNSNGKKPNPAPTKTKTKGKDDDLSDSNSILGYFFVLVLVGGVALYKLYVARTKVNDGSNRLWYRENRVKHNNTYLTREYDLDAEYGSDTTSGSRNKDKSSRRYKTYKDDQYSSDDDSNYSGGLELPQADWADERDEDYYDHTTQVAQDRQARNRIMMQMPKSRLTASRRNHHQTAGTTYSRRRNNSRERDLDWAMADHEMESSEEENDDSSDSDSSDDNHRRASRGYGDDHDSESEYEDEY